MKWIGQHIYDLTSRFRSDVYLEDISTGTIASGAHLGLDSNNKIVKAVDGGGDLTSIVAGTGLSGTSLTGPIPTLNIDASIPEITTLAGLTSIGTDGDTLNILGDTVTIVNTTSSKPAMNFTNQADDASGPIITLKNQRVDSSTQAGEANDFLGKIFFTGFDDQGSPATQNYASVTSQIHDATSGQESGILNLQVANHDGGLETGLKLTGGSVNSEIDVAVGLGAASVVTIPGNIDLAGDIDVDGTLETDALTIGGATIAAIGTTAITTLGTIGTGVWQGTAIASDQQKHLMHYQLAGYAQGDGSNYEIAMGLSDNNAPFEHNISTGSDGLTATTVANMSRTGGHVMPRACTLKRWTGWGTCAGSSTVYIGLFKVTPTRDDDTALAAVLLHEFTYTAMGNNKMEDFDETSFTATAIAAGDILITGLKSASGYIQWVTSTVEVEF